MNNELNTLINKYGIDYVMDELTKLKKENIIKDKEYIIKDLLTFIGEDPSREGLIETPKRALLAWREWCSGYSIDIPKLFKVFEDGAENYNELIVLDNIPYTSFCEHHLALIKGTVTIGYIPNGKIIGLSKFVRLVEAYSKRLQVQERMTRQIADSIAEHLNPIGLGVIVKGEHFCMSSRGVCRPNIITTTSALRGVMLEANNNARLEFLNLHIT